MADDTTKLRRGERNRVWAKPGEADPAGPYAMRFVGFSVTTPWAVATQAEHPTGGPGVYVWAANAVPDGPTGTQHLEPGTYRVQVRYVDGDLLDVEELPGSLHIQ